MSLAQRSVRSSTYTVVASGIQAAILLIRSILLARILATTVFGVYTFAYSFVFFSKAIPLFGLGGALIHRAPESEGEPAYRVHFTLTLIFTIIWAIGIAAIGAFFVAPKDRSVLWVILATQFLDNIAETGRTILIKRVLSRRLAIVNVIVSIIGTAAALLLAWQGFGVWSLVSTDIVAALIPLVAYYLYRPPWIPRLGLQRSVTRYFLDFGKRGFLGALLQNTLDNTDNLWTGKYLGEEALGFYSRAFTFATYPRRVLTAPLASVSTSTYAELKGQRKRLSQAFFRVNSLLIRTGFFFSGWLALIAPEFIRLVIGIKWLPMLTAFRLMLIYTLLDPINATISGVFVAMGEPEKVVRTRVIQFIVLIISMFLLGPWLSIAGIALAIDGMVAVGVVLLIWQARVHVDFSIKQMFGVPIFALSTSLILARVSIILPGILGSSWRTGAVKTVVFCVIYLTIVLVLERKQIPMLLEMVKHVLPTRHTQEK
jgi:O-antigen/teichoic acid export membrane protein